MPDNRFYSAFDLQPWEGHVARPDEYRNAFQINRDRIIHSQAFRRLQSKTQVFLSGQYDFYRTRLTHSIEVAQIGRSICESLRQRSPLLDEQCFIDANLVEGACLAHDLGHPPFGHVGEQVLNELMRPYGGFEGNAQTLRLLTETIFKKGRMGMNPCRALLDGVLKYKTLFSELDRPDKHFLYPEQEKYLDFVLDGQAFPLELTPGRARDTFRSIECQIMDWADDTAYSLNDIADGIQAGFITVLSLENWAAGQSLDLVQQALLLKLLETVREDKMESRFGYKIGNAIARCELVPDANFLAPTTRRYACQLVVPEELRQESQFYKKIALELVFLSPQLQQLDYKAGHILRKIFAVLAETYLHATSAPRTHLLPPDDEQKLAEAPDERGRARLLCDALANLTDRAAIRLYQRLFDPGFGSIVDLV